MNCDFEYCIYNCDFKCILNETKINTIGMCENCVIISIEKTFLEIEKERQLQEIEKRYNK